MKKVNVKVNKEQIVKLGAKLFPQIFLPFIILIVAALVSFFIMSWLVADVFGISHTYLAAGYEILGTLIVLIIIASPMIVFLYRIRTKEVKILSDAIKRVASGDYATRISTKKRKHITPIYASFNKMCAELESVQLLRNDFINSYSHEFKTPIASINGFASLLLEKELPPEEQQKYLQIIVDESARLSKLSTDTILLSKLSAQQIVSNSEMYDLSEQLRQCSIILSHKWLEKNITFSCDFPEISFKGDKEMMQHLWLNLLDNAIKYTPNGGEVSVAVTVSDDYAHIEISDTGIGIPNDMQQYLFDPYFQGDSSHAGQGLGLGLSIAKRIVELCGGTISVKSEPEVGSSFTVSLPL